MANESWLYWPTLVASLAALLAIAYFIRARQVKSEFAWLAALMLVAGAALAVLGALVGPRIEFWSRDERDVLDLAVQGVRVGLWFPLAAGLAILLGSRTDPLPPRFVLGALGLAVTGLTFAVQILS